MNHVKKLSLITDPGTLLLGVLLTTIEFGICSSFVVYYVITGERQDIIGSLCVFGTLAVLSILVAVLVSPRWYTKITFLKESVFIKTALKRPIKRSYQYYQYVYKAWYWHGSLIGIGKTDYIVISHRRISDEELGAINQLSPSSDVLKVRYSAKTYQKLMIILPPEMQYKLKVCGFQDTLS